MDNLENKLISVLIIQVIYPISGTYHKSKT